MQDSHSDSNTSLSGLFVQMLCIVALLRKLFSCKPKRNSYKREKKSLRILSNFLQRKELKEWGENINKGKI